jgi:CubicO group peptidase (beta-lactamase class C family)
MFICAAAVSICEACALKSCGCDYEDAIKTARETMWKTVAGGFCSGATIAFSDNGKIVYAEGIGVADRAQNRPIDVNTRFNFGSTGKMFAAVAILLLVDDGKVALDESAAKYIPEFRMKDPRYRDITVRMLFNHSSGLPGSTFYFGYETGDDMHKYLLDTLAESYLKQAPGAMPIYCNDGFTLAEIIVEKVSGEKYLDFLAKRIFKPLGMKNTGASVGEANVNNTAEHYDISSGKKYPREVVTLYGAGGLSSTASDMCRFVNSFSPYGRIKILSEASAKELLKEQPTLFAGNEMKGRMMASAFGWDYSSHRQYEALGIQVLAKSGGSSCYNTYIQTVPQYGVTVVYSLSGLVPNLEALSRPVLDAVLRCKKITVPEPEPIVKPVEAQPIPDELIANEGFYTNGNGMIKVRFDKENKKCDLISLSTAKGKEAPPLLSLVYNSGYLVCNEKNIQMYFAAINGEHFIAQHKIPRYGIEGVKYQKIGELKDPKKLRLELGGKKWLVRNMARHVVTGCDMNMVDSETYPELPGYVDFQGLKKIESPEFASIAATTIRDQSDLRLMDMNGETWVRAGALVYSMADDARKIVSGANRVVIKSENYNEWRKIEKGAIVKFEKPPAGARIIVYTERGPVYDSVVDSEEIYVPEGSFIFFAGTAGDMFKVFVR